MNVLRMRKFDERGYANRSVGDKTPFFGRGWNLGSVDSMVAGIRGVGRSIDSLWIRKIPVIFFRFFVPFNDIEYKNLDYFIEKERVHFLSRIRIVNRWIIFLKKIFFLIFITKIFPSFRS